MNHQPTDARTLMEQAGIDPTAIAVFERQVEHVRSGRAGFVREADISPYEPATLDGTPDPTALDATAVIRLNGGLGTSMGMDRAKSLLPVRGDLTFLDIIVRQMLALRASTGARLPLTLLHSFRTSADCLELLSHYPEIAIEGIPVELRQNRVPKLLADELEPVAWPADPDLEWCPPGHGDLYTVLSSTGYLDTLHELGYTQVFVANSDNLGAVPDPAVAGWFRASGAPFAIEAVRRTPSDRKGGHFAVRDSDGRLILRETAQTAPADREALADLDRHRFASTNNLWFDVDAMRGALTTGGGDLRLPVIVNRKTVDPSDGESPQVVQLETAMGAAIERFDGAMAVAVGRDRFVPVKTTNDLLVVRSDCYRLEDDARLTQVAPAIPFIDLDDAYTLIDDFDRRFPAGPPSLVDATSLVVRGDWTFGADVKVIGDVELGPEGGHIADGTLLDGTST